MLNGGFRCPEIIQTETIYSYFSIEAHGPLVLGIHFNFFSETKSGN